MPAPTTLVPVLTTSMEHIVKMKYATQSVHKIHTAPMVPVNVTQVLREKTALNVSSKEAIRIAILLYICNTCFCI